MEKFGWLYVGSGNIAASTARSILKGDHKISAVYGRSSDKVRAFAKKHGATPYDDYDSAVNAPDVDGVYIATPHTSHMQYALRAMELGKPVLCEKPVGVSTAEVDAMISAAVENNVYFAEAMWTWFSDVALTVRDWVRSGKIGKVTAIDIDYAFPGLMMSKDSRVLTPDTAGGALLDIGIYPITYCYNLLGYPDRIECNGKIRNGIDVSETVVLHYGNTRCTLNMSLSTLKEQCTIRGTRGRITLPMFHMARKATMVNDTGKQVFRGRTDYLTEFTRAAEEIRSGRTESEYIPFASTRDCMLIMDECRRQMGLVYPFEKQ